MINLRTAEEMYDYCRINHFGTGSSRSWAIKHFQILIDNLNPGENVYCIFIGFHNDRSATEHDGNFAYAFTDKRVLMTQKKVLGSNIQSVNVENINDITLQKRTLGYSRVCFDTYKETFNVGVLGVDADNIYAATHAAWDDIRSRKNQTAASPGKSPIEEVKGLKELLDMGAITQEEFDRKKRELLGL